MASSRDTTERLEDRSTGACARPCTVIRWVDPGRPRVDRIVGRLSVGRSPECAIRIEGEGISRRHAEVFRQGCVFGVRDLGSTNGTFVNGHRVGEALLRPGDVVRLGSAVGVVAEVLEELAETLFEEIAPGLYGGAELALAVSEVRRAAESDLPVVLIGPTGVGKERVAHAVHAWSRRSGPLLALNCAALPEALAEAELFGYRRGAFTGADRDSIGYFRAAQGGTLFLDEAGDLPPSVQAKLLRAIETRRVTALGCTNSASVDVRVIAAFHCSPDELVAKGRLREDLAARLAGITVELPPLRLRRSDVPFLFDWFLTTHSGGKPPVVDARLVERLCVHDWPQNVRELEFVAKRLAVLYGLEPILLPRHLPSRLREAACSDDEGTRPRSRREDDLRRLVRALRESGGNLKRAASAAGISRQRAYRVLEGRSVQEVLREAERGGAQ